MWTSYYRCWAISTEANGIGHGAFFEQCSKPNIVFLDTFDGIERIELHKGGNIKPKVLKELWIWEKSLHSIIILL
jgi:hypothetical protein